MYSFIQNFTGYMESHGIPYTDDINGIYDILFVNSFRGQAGHGGRGDLINGQQVISTGLVTPTVRIASAKAGEGIPIELDFDMAAGN